MPCTDEFLKMGQVGNVTCGVLYFQILSLCIKWECSPVSLANAHWQQRIMDDAIGRNARGCPCIPLCRDSSRTFSGPRLCHAWGFPWLQPAAGGGALGVHTNTSAPYSLHLHLLLQGHPLFSIREPVMPRTHPRRNLWNRRLTPVNKWLCIPICISSVGQRMHGKNSQGGWNLTK